jgi:hypothetical protein
MNQFQKIKHQSEIEFESFLKNLHDDFPELILKHQITNDMKNEFIEAIIAQYWEFKTVDFETTLNLTVDRYKSLNLIGGAK